MIPILYNYDETTFLSMGLGLIDCLSCTVTEELNGCFLLNLETHVNSKLLEKLKVDQIIMARPRKDADPEAFRISKVQVLFNGIVKIEAQHLSYQLNYIMANAMNKTFRNNTVHATPPAWFAEFVAHRVDTSQQVPFTMTSDLEREDHKMSTWDEVLSFKSLMQGREGSLLDLYGGEFGYHMYTVSLNKRRGKDRKYRVIYGENMQSMTYTDDGAELFTGAVGFYKGIDANNQEIIVQGNLVLTENAGNYAFRRVTSIDFSTEYEDAPSVQDLTNKASSYMRTNQFGKPTVNMNVKIALPTAGTEYGSLFSQESRDSLQIGDTITAVYSPAGIVMPARISRVVYDVLTESNKEVVVGSIKKKASSVLAKLL